MREDRQHGRLKKQNGRLHILKSENSLLKMIEQTKKMDNKNENKRRK